MQPSAREPALGAGVPPAGESPRMGWRARLSTQGAVAGMGEVVALIISMLLLRSGGVLGLDQFLPPAPPDWQTYHDSLGLFSVRLPASWKADAWAGTESYGDPTGSASEITEGVTFSDPVLGEASGQLYVNASPIHGSFERHWYCQGESQRWISFHGIPTQLFNGTSLIFDTANAHFQIDVRILSARRRSIAAEQPPAPTPPPAQMVAADLATLSTILGAFQPTCVTPLACN